jgi:hypothetical protein
VVLLGPDQVKQEARQLLRGIHDETLTRLDDTPFTDVSKPALDDARFIIAHEHGFSSWLKLKERLENLYR